MWASTRLLVLSVVVAVAVSSVDIDEQLETDEIIEAVNNAHTTWKAGRNFHPSMTKRYLNNLFGLKKSPSAHRLPILEDDADDSTVIPDSFDARQQWSGCISLQQVRDQGPCGSCWAVSAAAAFADRLCIASKTAFNGHLSAQDLLSCCTECGGGCNGGDPDEAWDYFKSTGIVTGGDYRSHEGCQPYTLPTCEHHVSGSRKNCSTYGIVPTPECKKNCYNKKYKTTFVNDLHKVKTAYAVQYNVKQIQKDIMNNGPMQATFDVYADFLSYKSGVYQHTVGDFLAGHAVKVIGWGNEDGTDYWLVANSWNTDWGDKGFFKIKRGNDECGFESDLSAGIPDVSK